MLLVMDIGNTNTVLGVYEGERLLNDWRITTQPHQTADEYGIIFKELFDLAGMSFDNITDLILSCVVPPLEMVVAEMARKYFDLEPLIVGPGTKTGMPVLYENPRDVGADRIVNGVAAIEKYGAPCIVIDFGTATTFDAISADGEYLGGIITQGSSSPMRPCSTRRPSCPWSIWPNPNRSSAELRSPACNLACSTGTSASWRALWPG